MNNHRTSAFLAALTALVCTIALAAVLPAPAAQAAGEPPGNSVVAAGSYFSYPNRSSAEKTAIRNRVVRTINATWGRYEVGGEVRRGRILMTTWSFNDWGIRDALVNAAKRGTRVRIIAASGVNTRENYKPWKSLRTAINSTTRGWAGVDPTNAARQCGGSCRGSAGTPHSKYFLFDDVGSAHQKNIVMQTSMNLTEFAFRGQWNQATVWKSKPIFAHYRAIHKQSMRNKSMGSKAYVRKHFGTIYNIFFPGGTPARDPVMRALNQVSCKGATSGGVNGRTRVRVIQYAIHDTRGNRIAKKLRGLWNNGCNVRIIYSISSRPVLKILRSRASRGPIPMKQSVIKNGRGEIVKYNHSKWLAISGRYGTARGKWTVHAGSANWSDFAFRSDEQMQQWFGYSRTKRYMDNFSKTWGQSTSKTPSVGRMSTGTGTLAPEEVAAEQEALEDVPVQPTFGEGIYKYMPEGG